MMERKERVSDVAVTAWVEEFGTQNLLLAPYWILLDL